MECSDVHTVEKREVEEDTEEYKFDLEPVTVRNISLEQSL